MSDLISQSPPPLGHILIVDDTPDSLRFLDRLLREHHYKVRKVKSGRLAVSAAQLDPPDLILLDIRMPIMNGYEVCEQLKASEQTRHIPIIFLSAMSDEQDKMQAFGVGGVDYITKPFYVAEVLARVATHLQLSRLQIQLQARLLQQEQEIAHRIVAETALQELNQTLESRIQERTAELRASNEQLLQLQTELQTALAQEQKLNQLRSELITTIAHEFNTPLTIINTAIALLNRQPPQRTDQEKAYFKMISDSIRRISQILRDAILLAEVESQQFEFTPIPIDLTQFCRTLIEQWSLPTKRLHQLSFDDSGTPTGPVLADLALLQALLTHLLSNALRYSPLGGEVRLELVYKPEAVVLRVIDQGIGIPATEINQVFSRFYRASNANQIPGTPGVGLGLAVVQQVVLCHRGAIRIESVLGQGTTVMVTLPYADSPLQPPPSEALNS